MLVVEKYCWYEKHLKILKVGGGDELTVTSQYITDTSLGPLARVDCCEGVTNIIFNTYGYILVQDFNRKSNTAAKLYNARPIPYGVEGSDVPRVVEIRRYPALEPILKTRPEIPFLPITGRLILAFQKEIPIGDFGTAKFARNCWIITEQQKWDLLPQKQSLFPRCN